MTSYKPWTKAEDEILVRMVNEGLPREEIAAALRRSAYAVVGRTHKLRPVDPALAAPPVVLDRRCQAVGCHTVFASTVDDEMRCPSCRGAGRPTRDKGRSLTSTAMAWL